MLYSAAIGACVGLAIGLLFGGNALLVALLLATAGVVLIGGRRNPKYTIAAAALAAAALGLLRVQVYQASLVQESVLAHVGETARITGTVSADPDRRATSLHATLAVSAIDEVPAVGVVLVFLPTNTALAYDDRVVVRGRIELPEPFAGEGGREFDYPGYLRARGIGALVYSASLGERTPGGWSVQGSLFAIKHAFQQSLERLVPQPQAALLEGVMLGERRGLPQELEDAFIETGLIHAVVLSGYNISIVATATLTLLSFLPQALQFSLGGIVMLFFVLMAGGGSTAVRALLMALIAILARYFHRSADALRALAFAAAALALWNPPVLLHDPSYILSMLATFGLITLSPWAEHGLLRMKLFRQGRFKKIREIAASTIAVQLFVLPALLYMTGMLSFVALPANVLALPVVPAVMLSGFVAGMLGFIHPLLALPFVLLTDLLLRFMLTVAEVGASLPFASTTISAFPLWVAIAAYIPLVWFALRAHKKFATAGQQSAAPKRPS